MASMVRELKEGKKRVAIWGLGYIGYSSMAYFARAGVKCIGYDIIEERVNQINETGKVKHKGKVSIPNMDFWLGYDVESMYKDGLLKATSDWKDLIKKEISVHLIAVPTEKGTEENKHEPCSDYLQEVIGNLCSYKNIEREQPPLIIIESTLSANIVDDLVIPLIEKNGLKVGEDILLGVAPRRDWFTDGGKNLKSIPRVVGGTNQRTTDLVADVLGLICDNILKADDHKHAAIVKSIENAYRQVEITLANQLSLAYPDVNMRNILKLVGSKWNIGTYHPSFGIGGYCIPLAPYYVLEGAKNPEQLTILKHSVESDIKQPERIVESLVKRGFKNVGILGIAYMADLKVHILSPVLKIIEHLKKEGISVKINDPYYTEEELKEIIDTDVFDFPNGLKEFDVILINADHMRYKYIDYDSITKNLENCKLILDNQGAWKNINFKGTEYHEVGDANWLE